MTGRELVAASLRIIGAIAPGETPSASEANDALSAINRMIDSWSTERLLIYTIVREAFTLTPGTSTYTMGSGGTFNTARPQWIEAAVLRDATSSPALETPLKIVDLEKYAAEPVKDTQSPYPYLLTDYGGYPTRSLVLFPVPSAAHSLVLWSAKPLTSISTLDTVLSLPPGYERALVFNGAQELAMEYGRPMSQEAAMIANESKATLKRANHRPAYLRADEALIAHQRKFNIYTGDSG